MIFPDENTAIITLTEDKILLFGSPHKDQIQYLVGDDIQPILAQKTQCKLSLN